MKRFMHTFVGFALVLVVTACARRTSNTTTAVPPNGAAPALVVGTFADDYGSTYSISRTEWIQDTKTRYHVVEWHADSQYVIAQNAPTNASDANKWPRIDWMPLSGTAPYTWGYCLSAYDAPTKAVATETRLANRATPQTGCNGFPFSRMKPLVRSPVSRSPIQEFTP